VASSSGVIIIVLIGALALGSSQDSGCQSTADDSPPAGTDADDDFSFEPESTASAGGGGSQSVDDPADDDFSFEPEAP
jgi:hypothetical protein